MELKKREPGQPGLSKEGGLTKVELTKKIGAVLEGKIREALSRRGA